MNIKMKGVRVRHDHYLMNNINPKSYIIADIDQHIRDVEHGCFSPFVLSSSGGFVSHYTVLLSS